MSDDSGAPEGATVEVEAPEVTEAEVTATEAVEEPVAEEAAPAGEAEPAVEEAPVEEPAAVEPEPAVAAGPRVARVYFCDRGHRTTSLWSEPATCKARPVRSAPECGRQLFEVGQLPEQVVKALNPLKASKKAAKKG
ncbi:MAG: hypothetical protein AB1416_07265 [Actinomycetota bacterium]